MRFSFICAKHADAIILLMARQCSVFISSTSEDLKEYRLAARDAALGPDSAR